jgi:hypothetical protein
MRRSNLVELTGKLHARIEVEVTRPNFRALAFHLLYARGDHAVDQGNVEFSWRRQDLRVQKFANRVGPLLAGLRIVLLPRVGLGCSSRRSDSGPTASFGRTLAGNGRRAAQLLHHRQVMLERRHRARRKLL